MRIRDNAIAFDKDFVKIHRCLRTFGRQAANHTIVLYEFAQYMPRQDPLRTVSNANVGILAMGLRESEIGAFLREPVRHLLGGPHRRSRFKYDQIARFEHLCDCSGSCFNIAQIG